MLARDMSFIDRLERRFGWLAFPGFLRYYAILHLMVFALQIFRPDISEILEFDRDKILAGEVWRVVTLFFANSAFGRISPITLLFLIFVARFMFMVGDGLEDAWGVFKASLFYYTGIIAVLVMNFIYPFGIPGSGTVLYGSAFLAFATLFPKQEILLMLILPIQIRYLGMVAAGAILVQAFRMPILIPFLLAGYANYLFWAAIPALRGTGRLIESANRRRRFNSKKLPASEAFHHCAVCDRTDDTDPQLEFRIGADGKEYCVDHLPR